MVFAPDCRRLVHRLQLPMYADKEEEKKKEKKGDTNITACPCGQITSLANQRNRQKNRAFVKWAFTPHISRKSQWSNSIFLNFDRDFPRGTATTAIAKQFVVPSNDAWCKQLVFLIFKSRSANRSWRYILSDCYTQFDNMEMFSQIRRAAVMEDSVWIPTKRHTPTVTYWAEETEWEKRRIFKCGPCAYTIHHFCRTKRMKVNWSGKNKRKQKYSAKAMISVCHFIPAHNRLSISNRSSFGWHLCQSLLHLCLFVGWYWRGDWIILSLAFITLDCLQWSARDGWRAAAH